MKTKNLIVAALLAWVICLIVPLQSYLGNATQLPCSRVSVLVELAGCFVVGTAILWLLLQAVGTRVAGILHVVLLSFVLCGYLEVGVLSIGCPALDGGTEYYENFSRGLLDAGVWALAVVLTVALRRWWKIVALALLVLTAASLFDVRLEKSADVVAASGQKIVPNAGVVKSGFYSSRRNIIIYVLDCLTTPHAARVLEESPEIASAFDGFVCYTNNVGMADCTVSGIAGIMTGQHLPSVEEQVEYASRCFSSNTFAQAYVDEGSPVFFRPGSFHFGYVANAPVVALSGSEATDRRWTPDLLRRMQDQQRWNLLEITAFRMTPFILKARVYRAIADHWMEGLQDAGYGYMSFLERWAYPILAEAPIRDDVAKTLQFWHTEGSHPPLGFNRKGERDGVPRTFYEERFEKTWYALSQLAGLLRTLKARGVYDQTCFVVLSDHGREPLRADGSVWPTDLPARAQSVLWVKPIGARGPVAFSAAPVSPQHIAALMTKMRTADLDRAAIEEILVMPNRLYREVDGNDLVDYWVDEAGHVTITRQKEQLRLDRLPLVECGRRYRMTGHGVDASFPAWFNNTRFYDGEGPRMVVDGLDAQVVFRLPKGVSSCRIALDGEIWPNERDVDVTVLDEISNQVAVHMGRETVARDKTFRFTATVDAEGFVKLLIQSRQEIGLRGIRVEGAR